MKSKSIVMVIMLFLLLSYTAVLFVGESSEAGEISEKKFVIRDGVQYEVHDPIRINNDTDFVTQASAEGWSGSGTEEDPYIISGYDIDAHRHNAIYIRNTTKYFVVRDCYLHNASTGAFLYNVTNGIMQNNTIRNSWYGLYLSYSSNNTIENNTITNNRLDGISLWYSSSNRVENNRISNNSGIGIRLSTSSNNTLRNNRMYNNGIFLEGSRATFTTQNIDTSNTVNDKPVYYYKNENMDNASIPANAGQVLLGNVSYLKIEYLEIHNADIGIEVGYSSHIFIANNTIRNTMEGIYLHISNNTAIENNTISNIRLDGIFIEYSSNNRIIGNIINNSTLSGIFLYISSNNRVENNRVSNNSGIGIRLDTSNNNIIVNNLIWNNVDYGIYIHSGRDNLIYHNFLYYNHGSRNIYDSSHVQAYDDGTDNYWNSTSGTGNYWHDWANNNDTNDRDGDGIIDWPYVLDGNAGAKDYYPLAESSPPVPELSWIVLVVLVFFAALVLRKRH